MPKVSRVTTNKTITTQVPDAVPATGGVTQPAWLELVRRQVEALRFGVVQIVVHDSRVVQIERTEKLRIESRPGEQ